MNNRRTVAMLAGSALILAALACSPGAAQGTGGGSAGQTGDELRQWATQATASSQYGDPNWAASQATGAPNTDECGDITTAWASAASNGVDTLELTYATEVVPTQISIVQTFNPGAVRRVEVVEPNGTRHTVYDEPTSRVSTCPFTLVVDVTGVTAAVNQVVITVDQSDELGWNEIDAVELVGSRLIQ